MLRIRSEHVLYILLVSLAIMPPTASYADVSLINSDFIKTVDVNTSPLITWSQGVDYVLAQSNGFVDSFSTWEKDASFTITISGLSGGTLITDKLVKTVVTSDISTFKVKISSALSGSLSPAPTIFKLRFWTGATAPTANDSTGVKAVLDLTAAVDTETSTTISGDQMFFVQLVCEYKSNTSGSSSVSIEPNMIL